MPISIAERLRALPPTQWMTSPPASLEALDALDAKYRIELPADYRELLLATNGCGLYGHRTQLNLESADDLLWHNEDPRFAADLPGMFVIGDDNSDAVFFYDPAGRLGKGPYALFQVDLGVIGFPYSRFAASDLNHLFDAILADKDLRASPCLGPLDHPERAE